jgi:hypothetical protein
VFKVRPPDTGPGMARAGMARVAASMRDFIFGLG